MKNEDNKPGWPRPLEDYFPPAYHKATRKAGRKPWLWILEGGSWTTFIPDRGEQAHAERLCAVCGEKMEGDVLLGVFGEEAEARLTSGPGCHPRCMALAAKHCPHFKTGDNAPLAFLYRGDGVGYSVPSDVEVYTDFHEVDPSAVLLTRAEVKDLAKTNPLGV